MSTINYPFHSFSGNINHLTGIVYSERLFAFIGVTYFETIRDWTEPKIDDKQEIEFIISQNISDIFHIENILDIFLVMTQGEPVITKRTFLIENNWKFS